MLLHLIFSFFTIFLLFSSYFLVLDGVVCVFDHPSLQVILGVSARVFPTEWREKAGPVLDFVSSSVATLVCSVVSTPQMVLTDRKCPSCPAGVKP